MAKILIIEDEAPLRQALSLKLKGQGYETLEATDGEEGLIFAKNEKPNVIILDILMPKMNGLDVLKSVRAVPDLMYTPIMVLTNLPEESARKKVEEYRNTEYLVKSDTPLGLIVTKIKDYLNAPKEEPIDKSRPK